MNALELNGHYYLGHSDYNFLMTYVLGYNKELLDEYGAALERSVYDTVRDYQWTLAEMMNLAKLVAIDSTGDGKSEDDYFGLTGNSWVGFNGFLTASNIPIAAQTQSGSYEVSLSWTEYYSKTYDIIGFFKELADGNYTYITQDYRLIHVKTPLSTGRSLMQVISVRDLEGLLNYNLDFGILPFPMYDSEQANIGYKSLQFGGYLGVLSYQDNVALVAETIEMLSYYSENVKITYYEKVLGKRIADMPDDAAMFEIVWDGITPDFGQTFASLGYDELGVCYAIPQMIHPETTQNLSSYLAARGSSLNAGFKKFLDGIE
jgi:ABC-type glycerol-3-phosphate transport system substrate-binding protein